MYAWNCMCGMRCVHAWAQTVTKHQSVNSSTLQLNLSTCNWTGHKKKGDHSAHGGYTPREEQKRAVSVWQVYINSQCTPREEQKGAVSAPYERCILVSTLLSVFTWGRDQCLHALFNDRCTVHGQHSPRKEASFSMTGVQYMVSTCPEKRGRFQYDRCTLHGGYTPREEGGFSMTGVH